MSGLLVALCGAGAALAAVTPQPAAVPADSQREIGIIDFYGLNHVRANDLRRAITINEGTAVRHDASATLRAEVEKRVAGMPGVAHAQANIVCCENDRLILYVGVQEKGAQGMPFRPAPTGAVRLSADMVQAGVELDRAIEAAVQSGNAQEDDSEGHSLARDPAIRGVQEHFLSYADEHLLELRAVLHECADAKQRALAASVIGYVTDKQAVVPDLVHAMSDPDSGTRNNAMRTLAVFTYTVPSATRTVPRVPYEPFIALLSSLDWTDRNKAVAALSGLSRHRDPALFEQLRQRAMTPLVEMARWKAMGHASIALQILARSAGYSEDDAMRAIVRGDRERVIRDALASH
jgi:hypothetical protein